MPGGRFVAKGRGRQTAIADVDTAVDSPFKTPCRDGRQFGGDPMADELLDETVASRHAPVIAICEGIERNSSKKAEEARPAAIDFATRRMSRIACAATKTSIDDRARRQCGHHRHTLGGGGDLMPREHVEGLDEGALAMSIRSLPSSNVMRELAELAAGRDVWPRIVKRGQLADQPTGFLEIVFFAGAGEPDVEFGDVALAQDASNSFSAKTTSAVPATAASARPTMPNIGDQWEKIIDEPRQPKTEPKPNKVPPPPTKISRPRTSANA